MLRREVERPDKVNFDRLWEAALRPAIRNAGYDAVRANEDIGALIINEMIERLAISDLVLADVSIPNGNVYYEVGIRHAAQKQGCIMTAATWSKALFDIDQMRQIRYPCLTESISDETAAEIIKIVEAAIPVMAAGDSPFYQVFPEYPEFDPGPRHSLQEERGGTLQFPGGNHRSAYCNRRSTPHSGACTSRRYYTGGPIQKAVAIELLYTLRDCTDWKPPSSSSTNCPRILRTRPWSKNSVRSPYPNPVITMTRSAPSKSSSSPTVILPNVAVCWWTVQEEVEHH